jgi:hypothetical protein
LGRNRNLPWPNWLFQLFHDNLAVTSIIEEFYKILNLCLDRFVPIKYNTNRTNSKLVKYPYALRRLLRRKAAAWRKYSTRKTPESLALYKNIASQCKSPIYSFSLSYENNLIANANSGSFYRYANSKFSCKSAVGPLCNSDGSLIIDAADKAAILLQTFIKNSVVDNGVLPVDSSIRRSHNKPNYIHFTPTLERRAIKKLKHKTRGGPDGIPPSFFINCCEELCYPLSALFTITFNNGILPPSPAWLKSCINKKLSKSLDGPPFASSTKCTSTRNWIAGFW